MADQTLELCQEIKPRTMAFIHQATKAIQEIRSTAKEHDFSQDGTDGYGRDRCKHILDEAKRLQESLDKACVLFDFVWDRTAKYDVGDSSRFTDKIDQNMVNAIKPLYEYKNNSVCNLQKAMEREVEIAFQGQTQPEFEKALDHFGKAVQKSFMLSDNLMTHKAAVLRQKERVDDKEAFPDDNSYETWLQHRHSIGSLRIEIERCDSVIGDRLLWEWKNRDKKTKKQLKFGVQETGRKVLANVPSNNRPTMAARGLPKQKQQQPYRTQMAENSNSNHFATEENRLDTPGLEVLARAASKTLNQVTPTAEENTKENNQTIPRTSGRPLLKPTPSIASQPALVAPHAPEPKPTPSIAAQPALVVPHAPEPKPTPSTAAQPALVASQKRGAPGGREEANKKPKPEPKRQNKTSRDLPYGSLYFKCPAPECEKVTAWSHDESEIAEAVQNGIELLPEDPKTKCRQIDNTVQQSIKGLHKKGYMAMKTHMSKCEHWQCCLRQAHSPSAKAEIEKASALYKDRRFKEKTLSKKERKALDNEKAKKKRIACEELLKVLTDNWIQFGPQLADKGIPKERIPVKGDGFMFD